MDAEPLISIGITCFNAADTIERSVTSALSQDWLNKEIIVVDDASTDASRVVLSRLVKSHPEVRFIRHAANRGYPGALNTIVGAARGTFVAFFDDDDKSRPERVRLQWQRLLAYERLQGSDLIFCYTNRQVVRLGQDRPTRTTLAIGRRPPEPHGENVAKYLLCLFRAKPFVWGEFGSCTLMARSSTLLQLGPFDEEFRRCAEWDMAIRLAFQGGHFIAVDQPLVTQYLTPGLEKSGRAPLRYARALRRKYRFYLSRQGLYWLSLAQAHARFHFAGGRLWKSRLFTAVACLLAPQRVFYHLLSGRVRALRSGVVGAHEP
jgi:glycosyltransferase involved in cell wall biosynthesis